MDAVVKDIYDKIMVKGEKVSKKNLLKGKIYVTKLVAKNYRLIWKARRLQKKTFKAICDDCQKKIEKIDTSKSLKEDYEMIDKMFCDKCKPYLIKYFDFMSKIKISDVKI